MTPPTTAPGPQPQPPRQASALLEVAIAAAPMLAAATRALKSFRIVSTSIHDGFCRPTQDQGTLHIDWLIPTERLFPECGYLQAKLREGREAACGHWLTELRSPGRHFRGFRAGPTTLLAMCVVRTEENGSTLLRLFRPKPQSSEFLPWTDQGRREAARLECG